MAIISARMNNKAEALVHFRNIYKYGQSHKDPDQSARALNNIGTIFLNSNQSYSALYYYDKVLSLVSQTDNHQLAIVANVNIGRSLAKLHREKEAEEKFLEAENLLDTLKVDKSKAFVYNEMAGFYLNEKKADQALKYAEKAYENIKVKYSFQNKDALQNLYKSYYLLGDYKKATEYFQKYNQIRDSLNIEEKAVNLEKEKISKRL